MRAARRITPLSSLNVSLAPSNAGRLTFAGSTSLLCTKQVTVDATDDDNVSLLSERSLVLR